MIFSTNTADQLVINQTIVFGLYEIVSYWKMYKLSFGDNSSFHVKCIKYIFLKNL